jgi:hypothetical protein
MSLLRGAVCRVRVIVVWICNPPVVLQLRLGGPWLDMCSPREMGSLVSALGGALGAPSGVSWRLSRDCEVGSVLGTLASEMV